MLNNHFKNFFVVVLLLMASLFMVACDKDKDKDKDKKPLDNIELALQEASDNDKVELTGVVYLVLDNGLFISDSETGKIFVSMNSGWNSDNIITVGSVVKVTGEFIRTDDKPSIKQATVTRVEEELNLPVAKKVTVNDIIKLSKTSKVGAWYAYLNVTGKISVDEATEMVLFTDDFGNSVEFTNNSTLSVLKEKIGQRVSLDVVLSEFASFGNTWRITFIGESKDVKITPFTLEEVKHFVKTFMDQNIASEIQGSLELPSTLENVDNLLFEWSTSLVNNIEILSLEEGKSSYQTKIKLPDEDLSGKLTLTVKYGEETPYTIDFDILLKKISVTSVSEVLDDTLGSVVAVKGAILGFTKNYVDTVRGFILQDLKTKDIILVDFDKDTQNDNYGLLSSTDLQIGDVVVVAGVMAQSAGKLYIKDINVFNKTNETSEVSHDIENAVVLKDESSWAAYANNMPLNALVKFEGAFMRYSTSSAPGHDNWIRLRCDIDASDKQPGNGKTFALNIRQIDEVLGEEWRQNANINTTGGDPVQFDGSFYAYVVYESNTYIQFAIVSSDLVIESNKSVAKREIADLVPTEIESNNITLPLEHSLVTGAIEWSSNNEDIISNSGVIIYPQETTTVTLTATFMVDGVEVSLEVSVIVKGITRNVINVSDALELTEETNISISGLILGLISSATETEGFILQDLVSGETIIVAGSTEGLKVGDIVDFDGVFKISLSGDEEGKKVIETDLVTVLSSDNKVLDYKTNAIIISSQEELLEFFANPVFGQAIKLTGDIFINSSNSLEKFGDSSNMRFHMNSDATGVAGIRYNEKALSLHNKGNQHSLGSDWINELLGINAEDYPGTSYPGFNYNGEMCLFLTTGSSSYYRFNCFTSGDLNLNRVP